MALPERPTISREHALFDQTAYACSRLITKRYSTSFSMGISILEARHKPAIYAIYGFVRYADEIVDTFLDQNKTALLADFEAQTFEAIAQKVSFNPVLHAFQDTVNRYQIDHELIRAFLYSMAMDIDQNAHSNQSYAQYIYGSAEVVGLMCLYVFLDGNQAKYEQLKTPARRLGAAFQKVNFLRDLKADYQERGRSYFPDIDFSQFGATQKTAIEADIALDFEAGNQGIKQLPAGAQKGVRLAYTYYLVLFQKIRKTSPQSILETRIRISNGRKLMLLASVYLQSKFG